MKKPLFHTLSIYAALVLWLFASASGMHGRQCLDGLDAPVSVHFDLLASHEYSHEDSQAGHQDVESKAQVSALKLGNLNSLFFAALLWVAIIWPRVSGQCYLLFKTPRPWLNAIGLRPPLRAPPAPFN